MLAKLYESLCEESSGIKLNYLTLNISDQGARIDFEKHKNTN